MPAFVKSTKEDHAIVNLDKVFYIDFYETSNRKTNKPEYKIVFKPDSQWNGVCWTFNDEVEFKEVKKQLLNVRFS